MSLSLDLKKLKKYDVSSLNNLCEDIRKDIISAVNVNGGHLASNLGAVELTVALDYVFDCPNDKIIFDVGHQCYAHKILTGRSLDNLRKSNGVSGFPKCEESEFDCFNTGHASTALSVACGFMRANILNNTQNKIVTVIGDGSFGGGEAFEALDDMSSIKSGCLIVLNDNEYTIDKTKGSILSSEENLKNYLKAVDIEYMGSADGHDVANLVDIFSKAYSADKCRLIRVVTKKGFGFECAPTKSHSISNAVTKTFGALAGEELSDILLIDKKAVFITAAMGSSFGIDKFIKFAPERFIDVGICEQHAVTLAAAMAKEGLRPYVGIYSSFLQRAYDQILSDVSLQNLPVTFLIDRSGLVDGDGETHQGIYDIDFLINIPNMRLFSACDKSEFLKAVKENTNSPKAIRFSKYCLDGLDNEQHGKKVRIYATSSVLKKFALSLAREADADVFSAYDLNAPLDDSYLNVVIEDSVGGSYFKSLGLKHALGYRVIKPLYRQAEIDELIAVNFDKNKILFDIDELKGKI